jgi:uncharacterized protein YdeI (YjbR/CyaY-like superfamily)
MAAYEGRRPDAAAGYTYEERPQGLPATYARAFRERSEVAWAFFVAQSPSCHRTAIGWILAAKREQTRLRRLEQIVAASVPERRWIHGAPQGMTR